MNNQIVALSAQCVVSALPTDVVKFAFSQPTLAIIAVEPCRLFGFLLFGLLNLNGWLILAFLYLGNPSLNLLLLLCFLFFGLSQFLFKLLSLLLFFANSLFLTSFFFESHRFFDLPRKCL